MAIISSYMLDALLMGVCPAKIDENHDSLKKKGHQVYGHPARPYQDFTSTRYPLKGSGKKLRGWG